MARARTRLVPLMATAAVAAGALLTACSNSEEASTLTTTVTPPKVTRSTSHAGTPAPALATATEGPLQISGGWVKQPPKKDMTAGYLTLRNSGPAADALTGVSTPVADKAELHTMQATGNGAEKMVQINEIPLPVGQDVELRSGGQHLMLVGLKKELAAGERVPVELSFASGKRISMSLPVLSQEQAPRASQSPSGGSVTPTSGSGHGGH